MRSISLRLCPLLLAALLPSSALADPQLALSHTQQGSALDAATEQGPSFNYNYNQTAPPGTSLSDSASNSEGAYAGVTSAVQLFYGSFHMEGSAAAVESVSNSTLGDASGSANGNWSLPITINSPGMDGQPATVRITLHASGDASGAATSAYANFQAYYSYSIGDGNSGAGFSGSFDTVNGWSGDGPPARTFSFDASCTFGQPCQIGYTASFSVNAGTGEPDFGDPQEGATQGSGNLSFRSDGVQVLDPANDNAPVSFTTESYIGSGAGQVTPAGASYAGFNVRNSAPDRFGTTLQLLDGTASADTQVAAAFVAPAPKSEKVKPASDAVDLTGTNSDPVVVQMNFDTSSPFAGLAFIELAWFKNSTGNWKNAILGNTGTSVPTFFNRAYNPATDFHLGYFGVDKANQKAWAVVNHNSRFGVIVSPLAVTSLSHPSASTIHLNCTGEPGAVNRLEASTTLAANSFTTVASVAVDETGSFQFDDTNPGVGKFYRVAYP